MLLPEPGECIQPNRRMPASSVWPQKGAGSLLEMAFPWPVSSVTLAKVDLRSRVALSHAAHTATIC